MTVVFDPRLIEGARLFNAREFFACHDILEDLWSETFGNDREFYQGLIHAAVALHHFDEGNLGGARKMYGSACRYLEPYLPSHQGVDVAALRDGLQACFAPLLVDGTGYPTGATLDPARIPRLALAGDHSSTEVSA